MCIVIWKIDIDEMIYIAFEKKKKCDTYRTMGGLMLCVGSREGGIKNRVNWFMSVRKDKSLPTRKTIPIEIRFKYVSINLIRY